MHVYDANTNRVNWSNKYWASAHTASRGFSHWHGILYIYMCLPFRVYFTKFGMAIGGFSTELKDPKLHKLGVFWTNYGKKYSNWELFFWKWYYCAKYWYRESPIFKVGQAPLHTICAGTPTHNFGKSTPSGILQSILRTNILLQAFSQNKSSHFHPFTIGHTARVCPCTRYQYQQSKLKQQT